MPNRRYTEATRDRLVDGTPTKELAQLWGKTPEQIRCMRYKVRKERGLEAPRPRRLSQEELKLIMTKQPLRVLAKLLKMSIGEVSRIRHKIRHGEYKNPVDKNSLEERIAAVKPLPF